MLTGEGFTWEYKCLFGVSRNSQDSSLIPDGILHTAYYDYYSSFNLIGVPGLILWFFYVKLPSVTRIPNCPRSHRYRSSLSGTLEPSIECGR